MLRELGDFSTRHLDTWIAAKIICNNENVKLKFNITEKIPIRLPEFRRTFIP